MQNEFDVTVSHGSQLVVTDKKCGHIYEYSLSPYFPYLGAPSVHENQHAEYDIAFREPDARAAAMSMLRKLKLIS